MREEKKVWLGLVLVAVAAFNSQLVQGGLLGSNQCTWGPNYWCDGLNTSAQCGLTTFCIKKVWEENPAPEDNDDVCNICKEMVKEARDQLESNETQTELKEVLEGSCDLIPIKIVAAECKKLADDFVPELVETLASEMDPTTVCTVARLCNSERIDVMLKMAAEKEERSSDLAIQSVLDDPAQVCSLCSRATEKIGSKLSRQSDEQLVTVMLAICGELGTTYADACKMSVIHNSEMLLRSLREMDEQVCYDFGLCTPGVSPDPTSLAVATRALASDTMECEFCKSIVEGWIEQFRNEATLQELKQVMDGVCSKLGNKERIDRCRHIVDDYYMPFIKEVAEHLNSTTVCTFITLCDSNGSKLDELDVTVLVPYDLESDVMPMPSDSTQNRLLGGFFMPSSLATLDTPGCAICKFVTYRLKEWLQDGHTQDEIQEGLHLICSTGPKSLKDQCAHFVDRYAPAVEQLIIDGIEIADVCNTLRLCGSQSSGEQGLIGDPASLQAVYVGAADDEAFASMNPIAAIKNKNENCATCQYVLNIVLETLQNKDNQDEIKNLMETVCRALPGKTQDRCEAFIEKYTEPIIDFIAKGLTADEICQAVALCESPKPQGQYCVICEFVIKTLDGILTNKTNVDEIKHVLEQVCSVLPKTVTSQCTQFVDTYTDAIIDMFAHGLSPEMICTGLGLCDKRHHVEEDSPVEATVKVTVAGGRSEEDSVEDDQPKDDYFCMLCEYFVTQAENSLDNKTDPAHIENVLDNLCEYMSGSVRRDCVDFVHSHADQIIEMFLAGANPTEVCAKLKLCQPPKATRFSAPTTTNVILSNDIDSFMNGVQANIEDQSMEERSEDNVKDVEGSELKDGQLCALCEYALDVVENQLLGNETLRTVEDAVKNVCTLMPESISNDCSNFVVKYGDMIIEKIDSLKIPPKEVCTSIMLCSSADLWDASGVGGNPCMWGPALWCASPFHASSCGTREYCAKLGLDGFD